jgi:hypothetical protein
MPFVFPLLSVPNHSSVELLALTGRASILQRPMSNTPATADDERRAQRLIYAANQKNSFISKANAAVA